MVESVDCPGSQHRNTDSVHPSKGGECKCPLSVPMFVTPLSPSTASTKSATTSTDRSAATCVDMTHISCHLCWHDTHQLPLLLTWHTSADSTSELNTGHTIELEMRDPTVCGIWSSHWQMLWSGSNMTVCMTYVSKSLVLGGNGDYDLRKKIGIIFFIIALFVRLKNCQTLSKNNTVFWDANIPSNSWNHRLMWRKWDVVRYRSCAVNFRSSAHVYTVLKTNLPESNSHAKCSNIALLWLYSHTTTTPSPTVGYCGHRNDHAPGGSPGLSKVPSV